MDEATFLTHYLTPCESGLDRRYTLPAPEIEGLVPNGEFIVQGRRGDTVSTNIIARFDSEPLGIRLVEVYKSTQNQKTGVFVRLVGTLSLVRRGYPFLFLDAAVSNVDPRTTERVPLSTRVAVHCPQADTEKRPVLLDVLSQQAEAAGLAFGTVEIPVLPGFWGPLWHVHSKGVDLGVIGKVRGFAWEAYRAYTRAVDPISDFDYRPTQDQMIYRNAQAEHHLFEKMGLDVAVEAQAAFFSVLCSAV